MLPYPRDSDCVSEHVSLEGANEVSSEELEELTYPPITSACGLYQDMY